MRVRESKTQGDRTLERSVISIDGMTISAGEEHEIHIHMD